MSIDILRSEKARREQDLINIESAQAAGVEAVKQLKEIDQLLADNLTLERSKLEGSYLERRHYTGDWPIVYSEADVTKTPIYEQTDPECNPYFKISLVQSGADVGIDPIPSPPNRNEGGDGVINGINRFRTFADTEDVFRVPALAALNTFVTETTLNPNTTNNAPGEPLPGNWPAAQGSACTGEPPPGSGIDETTCLANGGTWGPIPDPVWVPADTATGKLRPDLTAWRDDLIAIRDDVYLADTATVNFYQAIIDDCNTVLAATATDPVFVRNTGVADASTWGQTQPLTGADLTALNNIIAAADTGITTFISTRDSELAGVSNGAENLYFGIVKLRLHMANGSFSKLEALKKNQDATSSIVADHEEAIQSLTELIAAQL